MLVNAARLFAGPLVGVVLLASAAGADAAVWSHVPGSPAAEHAGNPQEIEAAGIRLFTLDDTRIEAALDAAPGDLERLNDAHVVSLPRPAGGFQTFEIAEVPVMAPKLAALNPDIQTYAGRGVEEPAATVRITTSPLGFQASVRGGKLGSWYVDPVYRDDTSLYGSYFAANLVNRHGRLIEPEEIAADPSLLAEAQRSKRRVVSNGTQLRTYRLALLSDPTYAVYHGPANVTAAKVALMNRVNQIYEDELAIRLVLIGNNSLLNFNTDAEMTLPDGPCGTAACFTGAQAAGCTGGTLSRNRIVIGQIIGARNFDIGHIIFGLSGGGVAGLGVVGDSGKARGCTGVPAPTGDFFAVDYVAHEMGHQFAGNHTFDGTENNCSAGNRNPGTSVEPGSGSSIMAYAGICDRDDLQPHSDPYFSQRSFDEIVTYTSGSPGSINEIQSAAFSGFGAGDSFTLTYNGTTSTTVLSSGGTYNTVGITAALTEILPAGTVPVVDGFGATVAPTANGFEVEFSGTLAGTDVPNMLEVTSVVGFTASVNDIDQGGPVDNQGFAVGATGNNPPAVTTPAAFTIPYRTPFALSGSATDANGDTLTYLWEQNDIGVGAGTLLVSPTKTTGPLFRVFGTPLDDGPYDPTVYDSPGENHPTTDPTRVFPDMAQILANNTNAATGDCPNGPPPGVEPVPAGLVDCYSEFLPTPGYLGPMHFRLTARDSRPGGGGIGNAETTVSLAPGTGPFLVSAPNSAVTWAAASTQTIEWAVAGTSAPPISATNVRISLSTDGGQTFPHVLADSTANDGLADVTVPATLNTAQARVKVEAIGNIFFDVSNADITITNSAAGPVVVNDAPNASITVTRGTSLPPVSFSASDNDSVGSALTATATGLPAGVALTPGPNSGGAALPGTASWTVGGGPVTAPPGAYPVVVTVADPTLTGSSSFLLTVQDSGAQTIDFPALRDRAYGDPAFTASATASSGLPVSFSATGKCTVANASVTISGAGSCTVTAHQAGNAAFAPAPDVARTFAIAKAQTETELRLKPRKAKRRRKVTATAAVSAKPSVSGSVTFEQGKRDLGTAKVKDGTAKVRFKAKRPGKVTATYSDKDGDFARSSDKAKLKVKRRRR